MKMILLALIGFGLAAAPLAKAQEEEATATPAESPEATEASPSPSPDTTVSVGSEKTASPVPKLGSSPAASPKSESPAPKPGSSPAAAASPARRMSVEATLKELENKWTAATPGHDTSVAQMVLADDYEGVTSKGKVVSKRGVLAEIKNDKDTYKSASNGRMDVRVFGNSAIVMGTSKESGKDKAGKEFNRAYRWTDTWVLRNGRWQIVASHTTLMPR